jgi:hypothetical protein
MSFEVANRPAQAQLGWGTLGLLISSTLGVRAVPEDADIDSSTPGDDQGLWGNVRRVFVICVDAMPLFCVMLWDIRWSNAGVEAYAPKIFVGYPGEVC